MQVTNTLLGFFRASGSEDPLFDVKSTQAWFARQPSNDYLATSEAMVRALEDIGARQPKVTQPRVLALMELDRLSTPIHARLLKQYLQSNLSDSIRQRLWHALDDLARWFAYSYENVFESMAGLTPAQRTREQMPGVVARMFHYRGLQAKNALFRYERWTPAKWKGLHAAYEAAVERDVALSPFALVDEGLASERTTAEQEYVLILLLNRINTGNLSANQIERAAGWLRKWMAVLQLMPAPQKDHASEKAEKGESAGGFWLDLGLGDGLLTRRPHQAQGKLMYLDIEPLQREIGSMLVELTLYAQRKAGPDLKSEATERLALLQRLESLWRPQATLTERRGVRVPADRVVQVAPGLTEMAAMLRGTSAGDPALSRFRQGDPVEVEVERDAPTVAPLELAADSLAFTPTVNDAWRMQDASESGLKLVSRTAEAAEQRLGSLLGVLDEGQTRWKVGIVRRLKKFPGGHTELGVAIVSHHCVLITPKRIASGNTGYSVDGVDVSVERKTFDALYLPPSNRPAPGRTPLRSMIVPVLEFAERRRFLLDFEDKTYMIELTTAFERGKDWIWCGFEVVREPA